jgi:hypothetical protein
MGNPLFEGRQPQQGGTNPIEKIKSILSGQSDSAIEAFGRKMYAENPAFRNFVDPMRGMNEQDICKANGVNYDDIWGRR